MNILQISPFDIGGGAEQVAWSLFQAYRSLGHDSRLLVSWRRSTDEGVVEIHREEVPSPAGTWLWQRQLDLAPFESRVPALSGMRRWMRALAMGGAEVARELGLEDFSLPSSYEILASRAVPPDIVHFHNLHGYSFDLRALPSLSRQAPIFLTLHDEWLYTGHCAYTLGCHRWERGCGRCPDLEIYPAIRRDATRWNWLRKRRILGACRLRLIVPSQWLADRVMRSLLAKAELRVIRNGIDLELFRPGNKVRARQALNLPPDMLIILFVAQQARHNRFKDFSTVRQALALLTQVSASSRNVMLVVLGDNGPDETVNGAPIRFVPFLSASAHVAQFYQAADLLAHASRSENYPTTVLEGMASGLPVVATAVGGTGEQIIDSVTGYLTPPGDAQAMAARINHLLDDSNARWAMGDRAHRFARANFGLAAQVQAHLDWYREVLSK